MKKDEITRVRLLSLAVLMALSLFILLVPIGSNEFGQIISKMNNNALNIPESQNSVYNLYYYTGFNVVYQLFFSLTILFTAMSVAGILLRIGNTGIAAFVSAILNLLTGMLLLFARIWESSVSMHAMIDSVYLDGVVKEQIKTTQLLDKVPVLYILLIVLGILELLMVKSSGIMRIKMFAKNKKTNAVNYLVPALIIYVWAGFIRQDILSVIIRNGDSQRMTINEYLTSYYIGNKIFFNWSWMIMLLLATIICIIIQSGIIKGLSGRAGMLAGIGIPALVTIMPSVIYAFNPPALFGYITLDISLCDMTDNAFYMYLVTFCVCMTAAYILIYLVISGLLDMRKLAGIFVINVVTSVILMIIVSGKSSLAIQYMPWIVADCASVILAFICVAVKPVNKKMAELCGASKKV
ncbi:hypothetical protein [Lachnospira eligens]|jgi:hypothetical protein|uniref:Uncharacterized protein n=1 Tax=Lachnospira eligens TaxID=39485 RepID=A0A415MDW2_9FIRM|nr:hypothetical protein [Lachnospira eligens]RHA50634.1 hypothetical protein DW933_03435 [Lachnospira eligens]RHL70955.1 hypothetical protein DW007_02080 [Lachnospira eligens]